ncbi:MAG: hypothetical protein PF440_03185 [Thiomicrorhabdus sp.]|jgi:hypothetical protein|nr:hypothetical protein [Thiomicrorhabdus sp.]
MDTNAYDLVDAYLEENFTKYKILNWDFDDSYINVEYFFDKSDCNATVTFSLWEVMAWVYGKTLKVEE